jgi:hypothetical protein
MMTGPKVQEYISAEPFRPFRIRMASGRMYEIKHPEMIMVGRSSAKIYKSSDSDPNGPPLWQKISLMLTESLEPLETKISESIN